MARSHLLLPVDFSPCTAGLVAEAARLAARLDATLTLFHATAVPPELARAPLEDADHHDTTAEALLDDDARAHLDSHAAQARAQGIDVQVRVGHGTPAQAILNAAVATRPEMIVMGTHGRSGLARVLLGSVAEQVVRRATVPVLTVRTQHHAACDAPNCAVCTAHKTPVERRVAAELEG